MLGGFPVEVLLQIADSLGPRDIVSLSLLDEFSDLFCVVSDHGGDLESFRPPDKIKSGAIAHETGRDSSKIYLIEISDLKSFDMSDLDKFSLSRKVISVINTEGLVNNGYAEVILKRLMKEFHFHSKFMFFNFPNVSFTWGVLDPKLILIDNSSNLSIDCCNSYDTTKSFQFSNIKNLSVNHSSESVIKSLDLERYPTDSCSILFLDFQRPEIIEDLRDLRMIAQDHISLKSVYKLGDCILSNVRNLTLSFSSSYRFQNELRSLHAPNLEILTLGLSRFFPKIADFEAPNLRRLTINDLCDDCEEDSDELHILKDKRLWLNIDSLKLHINNDRVLNHINHPTRLTSLLISSMNPLSATLTRSLKFPNLSNLTLMCGQNCPRIPSFQIPTLKYLKVVNSSPLHNPNLSIPSLDLHSSYLNLEELSLSGINDDNISSWFKAQQSLTIKRLRLLMFTYSKNIDFNGVFFKNLEFLEVNGRGIPIFPEIGINLNAPILKSLAIKIDITDINFDTDNYSIWDEYLSSISLKIENMGYLKNLIVDNFSEVFIRDSVALESIYHGGDLQLMRLDADYLPNLKNLVYKNLRVTRPVQSVNYISPFLQKEVIQDSIHPLADKFSY